MQTATMSESSNGVDSIVKKVVKEKEEIGIIEEDEEEDDDEEEVVMIEEDDDDDSDNEEEEEEKNEKKEEEKRKEEEEKKKKEETREKKAKKEKKQSKNKSSLLQNGKTNGTITNQKSKRSYTKDKDKNKKKTTTTTKNETPLKKKKRRWKRKTVALRRIVRFQRMTKKHFPFAIADRMVRRIAGEFHAKKLQLARGTVDMIREVIEANLVEAIKCCVLIRANCKNQVLLTKQDLDLYKEIRYKKRFSDS